MTNNEVSLYNSSSRVSILPSMSGDQPLTMSSREIAELTGKRHDHVIRDIEKMLSELTGPKFGVSDFLTSYKDSTGRSLKEYRLPKRETMILVSGYSIPLRAAIVDRWQELEEQVRSPVFAIPQTLPEALRLAAEQMDRANEAEQRLALAAPKVEAYDRVCDTDQLLSLEAGAKPLGLSRNTIAEVLRRDGYLFQRKADTSSGFVNLPYQRFIDVGYFEVKVVSSIRGNCLQTFLTYEGLLFFERKYKGLQRKSNLQKRSRNVASVTLAA